ncbi:shikimate dehydrogenase family protein [Candidatus Paracaedibacter symbiosus]|uniref:shikimate dehydrogenase family protein n=1 Tax=Candidatus Paracaedibacter symbiosus TaxID=244582 RepID=UPI0005094587|nr:hypothetical protein [Candidatus Paracaedibacter symbiosus]
MTHQFLLGLLGHNIDYSLSPKTHHYWMELYGIKGKYQLYDIDPANKHTGLESLLHRGLHGFNVTIPYKEFVFKTICPSAARLMAVNTIYRRENGNYAAINTDVLGGLDIFQNLQLGNKIVILGNGGTTRGLVEIFYQLKVPQIHIVERQTKIWHSDYKNMLMFHGWEAVTDLMTEATLLINTVPNLEFQPKNLNRDTLVCDYVYGGSESLFMTHVKKSRQAIIPGIEFLIRQAQHSFQYWFNIFPEITPDLRRSLYR